MPPGLQVYPEFSVQFNKHAGFEMAADGGIGFPFGGIKRTVEPDIIEPHGENGDPDTGVGYYRLPGREIEKHGDGGGKETHLVIQVVIDINRGYVGIIIIELSG
jgi:hypothetical protein